MNTLSFRVYGDPKPQGSKKAFPVNGRTVLVESAGKPLKDWRNSVTNEALNAWLKRTQPWDAMDATEAYGVEVVFFMDRPQAAKRHWVYARKRPDIDKLVRSTLDALTGVLWVDDSQVVCLAATKELATPPNPTGAYIEVTQLGESEKHGMLQRAGVSRCLDRKGVAL